MSLWLCLRFSQLPLQCLNRSEDIPVVVLHRQRVLCANDHACTLGIKKGMSSATLRALAGEQPVLLLEKNPDAQQRCLQQLCCWAYSVSPSLHCWRDNCVQLEISGCLTLFGGLDALLTYVDNGINQRGYRVEYGLAPTSEAAWLLSFAAPDSALAIQQPLDRRLAPLPLSLLDDFAVAIKSLQRAGLHCLGDILSLPSPALARRCGQQFNDFLQRVLGRQTQLQIDYQPPATFSDEYWFGYDVKSHDELLPAVQLLLTSLCGFLHNTQLQTTEVSWQLTGCDGRIQTISVRSATAHSDQAHWYRLTTIHLEQLQHKSGVEGLALHCLQLSAGQQVNIDLFSPQYQHEPMAALLDRLRSRLGLQAVAAIGSREEHLPERALFVSVDNTVDMPQHRQHCAQRPFWLLPQPQALRQSAGQLYWHGPLHLLYGPERIEDNWWQEAVSRDYYVAADPSVQHYWIFYDRLSRSWYLHGVFS